MGETGSTTRGWKEEESCTREWFCVLGLGKPRPKTQNHSRVQDSSSFHPRVMEPLYLTLQQLWWRFSMLIYLFLDVYCEYWLCYYLYCCCGTWSSCKRIPYSTRFLVEIFTQESRSQSGYNGQTYWPTFVSKISTKIVCCKVFSCRNSKFGFQLP